jgi:hypothetical protein
MAEPEKEITESDALVTRVAELEQALAQAQGAEQGQRRLWNWVVAVGATVTSLALIVVFLGGGSWGGGSWEQGAIGPGANDWPEDEQNALSLLVEQRSGEFQRCFTEWAAEAEAARPGWAVLAQLTVQADPAGQVQEVELQGEGLPPSLARCLEQQVRQWTFPRGGSFTFELPFAVEDSSPAASGES